MTVQNRQLSYFDSGVGTPIIFLHPPGLGKEVFQYQEKLSQSYRIIRYDMCGHGESEGTLQQVTIELLAEELLQLMDELHIAQAVICGYSAGGTVAQHFTLTYPDRVLALVLSGGFPHVTNPWLKAEFQAGMTLLKYSPNLLGKILVTSHGIKQEDRDLLWKTVSSTNHRNWLDFYQASYHYSCSESLSEINAPVLVVYGQYVKHIRTYQKEYETKVKNGKVAIVPHAFHEIPVREWRAFNQLVDTFVSSSVN
ncbi:alpha/beta fold hydrolase [Pseudalkalibacillus berkeleyi]|uniref:Alpha/beta hydrolase n=1 Tax=Pseudalkalibacillus berkeleyi TaxID=1069813 RepID=A0ABS9H4B6_9BACL|nr:alpha/beta hydrolase [Pseudalkalibacillus berkeleyi]MCF6138946.1 alpha/beta hydrolase [Pseudalkalibacillus berkeleyi]